MTSQTSFGSSMLFQSINDDLNASLATADELSKEFNSLLKEVSSDNNNTASQARATDYSSMPTSVTSRESSGSSSDTYSTKPFYHSPKSVRSIDSVISGSKNQSSSPVLSTSSLPSPKSQRECHSPLHGFGSDSYSYKLESPKHSPKIQKRNSPASYDKKPRVSASYMERSVSPIPIAVPQSPRISASSPTYSSSSMLNPFDSTQMGRRSPRPDRSPSPLSFNYCIPGPVPRNFRQPDEHMQRQKTPSKWNETDLDMSYERKTQNTYDKTEWMRPSVPNSRWRESNLDGPSQPSAKKESRTQSQQSYSSLPRNTRIVVPPDSSSQNYSPYQPQQPQPIISRISIPPTSAQPRQRRPIPLSVIMRLQNPYWSAMVAHHPSILEGEADMTAYQPAVPILREYFYPPATYPQQKHPELRQPAIFSDVLNPTDVDAELERIDLVHQMPITDENLLRPESTTDQGPQITPRPLSPTNLQPVVAPEAQAQEIPNLEELLRIRAEIPRALKRRGSMDQSQPLKKASQYQPNQYKNLINKLFHRREHRSKAEAGSDNSSSSDGEDSGSPASAPTPQTPTTGLQDYKNYHSILRKSSREQKSSGKHARLNPLVLALDGALVGELETVQRAMQEMNDPSQPNDEGITALHNAICGGHYNVVDFLVRIGANVSAPDSHGWTPLHCAASCNDRSLCEFLVRNGAAVMAITESDSATASQKCDPYAVGFEECENFLRGVEEAMGVENSGVLYALWSYPAQAADELSFKEGDMVTILQKHEGSDWWWASLCGREGFVPNNYFGLFPKVRPKSLC